MNVTVKTMLVKYLRGLSENDLMAIWNRFCRERNYAESIVYTRDQFDGLLYGKTPTEIVNLTESLNGYVPNYFVVCYRGIEEWNFTTDCDYDALANYLEEGRYKITVALLDN